MACDFIGRGAVIVRPVMFSIAALALAAAVAAQARQVDQPPESPRPASHEPDQPPGIERPASHEPDQNTPAATAQEVAPVLTAPACETPQHHQFDFWLGEWQVFDAATNTLVAFDRIEKLYEGCIVQQSMNFVTDLYRRPGATYRLAGISVNRYDGEGWMEMWADNQWGAIALRGSPDATAAMVLKTITPSRHRDLKIVWEKHADGSVRILQYVAPAGSGKWQKYGDLIYRRNR